MQEQILALLKYGTALLLLVPCVFLGQRVDEYQVKAAYVYNFAKFVEWPPQSFDSADAPLRLCVWNDSSFQADLERIVSGKKIATHLVTVLAIRKEEQVKGCHLMFVGAAQMKRTRNLLAEWKKASVLTVGESGDFLESGGIINFVLQNEQVQFDVNSKAAADAGLQISSRVLSLARSVQR
jgi:uncharacterized protein DUF4154